LLRFLAEKLSYEALLLKHAIASGDSRAVKRRSRQVGALLLEADREVVARAVTAETCETLNKITYYLSELGSMDAPIEYLPKDLGRYDHAVSHFFGRFVEKIRMLYGDDWRKWPDSFVDTYAWVGLTRIGQPGAYTTHSPVDAKTILAIYDEIRLRLFVSEADLKEFRRHATEAHRLLQ
jgi:hypothetical protein